MKEIISIKNNTTDEIIVFVPSIKMIYDNNTRFLCKMNKGVYDGKIVNYVLFPVTGVLFYPSDVPYKKSGILDYEKVKNDFLRFNCAITIIDTFCNNKEYFIIKEEFKEYAEKYRDFILNNFYALVGLMFKWLDEIINGLKKMDIDLIRVDKMITFFETHIQNQSLTISDVGIFISNNFAFFSSDGMFNIGIGEGVYQFNPETTIAELLVFLYDMREKLMKRNKGEKVNEKEIKKIQEMENTLINVIKKANDKNSINVENEKSGAIEAIEVYGYGNIKEDEVEILEMFWR